MRKTVKIRKDENGEYYLTIRQLLYGTGIPSSRVESYELNKMDDNSGFIVTLYDKNGKIINLRENNE